MNIKIDTIETLYEKFSKEKIDERFKDILDKKYYLFTENEMTLDDGYYFLEELSINRYLLSAAKSKFFYDEIFSEFVFNLRYLCNKNDIEGKVEFIIDKYIKFDNDLLIDLDHVNSQDSFVYSIELNHNEDEPKTISKDITLHQIYLPELYDRFSKELIDSKYKDIIWDNAMIFAEDDYSFNKGYYIVTKEKDKYVLNEADNSFYKDGDIQNLINEIKKFIDGTLIVCTQKHINDGKEVGEDTVVEYISINEYKRTIDLYNDGDFSYIQLKNIDGKDMYEICNHVYIYEILL